MSETVLVALVGTLGVCCFFFCCCAAVFAARTQKPPPNRPEAFLKIKDLISGPDAKKVVYFLGDSHFHGRFGFDVVDLLNGGDVMAQQNPDSHVEDVKTIAEIAREADISETYQIVNDGLNGRTTKEALKQVATLVACRPAAVVIMLGTNDLYRAPNNPEKIEQAVLSLVQNLESAVDSIRWGVATCKIGIVSVPVIGEQLDSPLNHAVEDANRRLADLCQRKACTFLPLHEFQIATISGRQGGGPEGEAHLAAPLVKPRPPSLSLLLGAAVAHVMMNKSCRDVSKNNGLIVTVDGIHMNHITGAQLALMIARFLKAAAV